MINDDVGDIKNKTKSLEIISNTYIFSEEKFHMDAVKRKKNPFHILFKVII